jgi:ABC-type multidrug transport system ATPase subunit
MLVLFLIFLLIELKSFQDPLSALDAHIGKAVFTNVLQNESSGTTRVLVTHALHFLPQVDYIYTVFDGRITERGTYTELMQAQGVFSNFVAEFGTKEQKEEKEELAIEEVDNEGPREKENTDKRKHATPGVALMQAEERNTGAVGLPVYRAYMAAEKGFIIVPSLVLSIVVTQGVTVMSSYW